MTLSIKALLPEIEKPEEEKEVKGKNRKAKEPVEEVEEELREWKDNDDAGVSIAEMLAKSEN